MDPQSPCLQEQANLIVACAEILVAEAEKLVALAELLACEMANQQDPPGGGSALAEATASPRQLAALGIKPITDQARRMGNTAKRRARSGEMLPAEFAITGDKLETQRQILDALSECLQDQRRLNSSLVNV